MSEKPIAVILAGIGVVSVCALCAAGPAVVGAATGWAFGWITGLGPMATVAVAILGALLAFALFLRWGDTRPRREIESTQASNSVTKENR